MYAAVLSYVFSHIVEVPSFVLIKLRPLADYIVNVSSMFKSHQKALKPINYHD